MNHEYSLSAILIAILLWTACEPSDPVHPFPVNYGKIKSLTLMEDSELVKANFKYIYDDVTGDLHRISADSFDVCTIVRFDEDSLAIEWRNAVESSPFLTWIATSTNGFLDKLYRYSNNDYFLVYRAVYNYERIIDTFYLPDLNFGTFTITNRINHGYAFAGENCQSFTNAYTYNFNFDSTQEEEFLLIAYDSRVNNNIGVPLQIPYIDMNDPLGSLYLLDPLYVLSQAGIRCIPNNRHLIRSWRSMDMYYDLDAHGNVNYMLATHSITQDTIAEVYFDYYY